MRRFLGALLACAAAACTTTPSDVLPPCDLVIVGGLIVDGTGAAACTGDLVIREGRITAIADAGQGTTSFAPRDVLDATGMVVAPGFIDVHAHGDPLRTPEFRNFVTMGVTTICLGLDGSSPAGSEDFGAWFDAVDRRRPAVHVTACIGHGSARDQAGIGASAGPDAAAVREPP